jgi:hypothetical protein
MLPLEALPGLMHEVLAIRRALGHDDSIETDARNEREASA